MLLGLLRARSVVWSLRGWRPALGGAVLISASVRQSARFVYASFARGLGLDTEGKSDAGCCLGGLNINEC